MFLFKSGDKTNFPLLGNVYQSFLSREFQIGSSLYYVQQFTCDQLVRHV